MRKVLSSERLDLLIMTEAVAQRCPVSCSYELHKIHMKTLVPESLFLETEACNFILKRL